MTFIESYKRFNKSKNSKFVYYKCLMKTIVKIVSGVKNAKDAVIAVFVKNVKIVTSVSNVKNAVV